jgi:hypothetical protein
MDLAELDFAAMAAKGADLEIIHPVTRKGTGIFFKIIGEDCDEYRRFQLEKGDATMAMARAMKPGQRNKLDSLTTEQMVEEKLADTAFCVRGWFEGIRHEAKKNEAGDVIEAERVEKLKATITLDGNELVFSKEKTLDLLKKYPVLMEQLREGIKSRALFMPDSAKS